MMRLTAWLAGLTGVLSPALALADQPSGSAYGYHMWDGGWHGWFFGPIMMILFIALLAVVVVLLLRRLGGPGQGTATPGPAGKTPLDILKERFARGEIDAEEFTERRRLLGE